MGAMASPAYRQCPPTVDRQRRPWTSVRRGALQFRLRRRRVV